MAHDRQAGAIDDEMDGVRGRDATEHHSELLTPPRECGVVRRVQIGAHQGQDRPHDPSVWRKGKPKTSRRINAVSIATSENRFCPPGRPEGDGRHASVAAAESHRVTSPRWTSARSYSRQFPTRYVVLYFGCTFDFISRIVRRPRPQDQPVDDARRSKGQEPCTKASPSR